MSNLHMECKYCGEPFQVGVDRRTDSLLPPHRCRTGLVQQEEPEGVCAFPNCSCTENRCPAKGERGPFCDHGFHPRLCGRCAPVPEAVTDEDEVQCQMCKTVQPRPDKECGHCGAGPKYLCPIHTRPAAVPVQQEPEERCDHDWIVETRTASIKVCQSCGMEQAKNMDDAVVGLCAAVPSVGLRDRVACELANLEYERSGRPCETEDFYANADRVLSVLHEAGTQEDEDDGYEVMCEPVAAMVEEVRAALVPVQQDEPEGLMCSSYSGRPTNERCTKDAGHGGLHEGEMLRWSDGPRPLLPGCKTCGAATGETCHKDCPQQIADTMTVPSVGLRDRVRDEVWRREWPEFTGTAEEVESDRHDRLSSLVYGVLSVLHEAGTQDSWATFGDDMTLQREVAALNVQLVDLAESLQKAVERHQSNLRFRAEQLQDKAEAGTQELTEADRPYCPDCGMRYDEDCADCDVGDDFRAQNARFASPAEAGTQEEEELAVKRRLALIDRITDEMLSWDVAEEAGWDRSDAVCRAQWVVDAINDVRRPALAEAGTQEDAPLSERTGLVRSMGDGLEQVMEAVEGMAHRLDAFNERHRSELSAAAPAVSGSPDTKEDA